jgi:UDP-glucose 4-epimerase
MTFPPAGTPRAGRRRIVVAGVHRRVAVEFVGRLLESPTVEVVLGVDRGACPPDLLGHDPARFAFVSADLRRRRQVDNLFLLEMFRERPVDTVVNLAFQGNPLGYSFESHEFNVDSTRHLVEACLHHGVGKFVFLSSDAVYRIGPRVDFKVREDAEINLDPKAHPILRDIVDAEFFCRAKMDSPDCEVMVLRPSGVLGGGELSGLNLLLESRPPLLPVGFDPLVNPTSRERLARDLLLAVLLHGKGLYNAAGPVVGPLSRFMAERGVTPLRLPGPLLRSANRVQRLLGRTRYHAGFNPRRLYYSLVLDDRRFESVFRSQADSVLGAAAPG